MTSIQVWDWPLRLCHWGLAVAIVGAYGTAELGWRTDRGGRTGRCTG